MSAFTLLEVILALSIMSVLAVSLFTALSVSFKAKRGAEASVEQIRDVESAMDLIRAEFEAALPPRGITARGFTGRAFMGANGGRDDDVTFFSTNTVPPSAQPTVNLTGLPPMQADIKEVELIVVTLQGTGERVLARRVTSNTLAPIGLEVLPDDEILVRNVSSFQLRYYDGLAWQEEWDASLNSDALPAAVEVTLELDPPESRTSVGDYRPLRISRVVQIPCAGEGELDREAPATTGEGGTGEAEGTGAEGGGT